MFRLSVCLLAGLLACGSVGAGVDTADKPVVIGNNVRQMATRGNDFGFDLLRRLAARAGSGENVVISPVSISYALAMTYNGARGRTRDDMASALGIPDLSRSDVNRALGGLMMVAITGGEDVSFEMGNAIWYREGLSVMPDFSERARTYYDAQIAELDFNRPEAAGTVNDWIEQQTHGRIRSVIRPPIDPSTVMMLVNAMWFRGNWYRPFDAAETKSAVFHVTADSSIECRMMRKLDHAPYFQDDLMQAMELPYGGERFSAVVLLPREGRTTDDVLEALTAEKWRQWTERLSPRDVRLGLPRFTVEYDASAISSVLRDMGMTAAFTPGADFGDMVAGGGIWIDSVIHKTYLRVDEQGSEAAAATVVAMKKGLVPQMEVNRPFLLAIRDRWTGAVIFVARIASPDAG